MWPVLRQYRLDIEVTTSSRPVLMKIDLNSSFVLDPSEPIATPRLAYVPGSTLLVRIRTLLGRYHHDLAGWETTTQKHVRRASIRVIEAGENVRTDAAFLDQPISSDADELHPESPVACARDALDRMFAAVVRRDRGIVVGEIVPGEHRPMVLVPSSFVRRPLSLALAAVGELIIVVHVDNAGSLRIRHQTWGDAAWSVLTATAVFHPLSMVAASGAPDGELLFVAGIKPTGELYAGRVELPTPSQIAQYTISGSAPKLYRTSALAVVSPTRHDDLAFAIATDGRLVAYFVQRKSGHTGVLTSTKRLLVHSRLGAAVESADRVHCAGIDTDGMVRRWAFKRSGDNWDFDGDSLVDGVDDTAVPNPWTDVALSAVGRGWVAVAGVDEADEDPETRTHAFRVQLSMPSRQNFWARIPNG
jgi:hypothetical protein